MNELIERLQIRSYFSIETDLALIMSKWPKFLVGEAHDVELRNPKGDEIVTTKFIKNDVEAYVSVCSSSINELFERVVGSVVYAMSAHSDNLMIDRLDR